MNKTSSLATPWRAPDASRPRRVKILGAGSIGNHLANAARTHGWAVDICDVDPAALERTKTQIYPARYGRWDEAIGLHRAEQAPRGGYDLIMIGTPPDSHLALARQALDECNAILIEKPLCPPDLTGTEELVGLVRQKRAVAFVGYDHVVGRAAREAARVLRDPAFGPVLSIDVEFREHWAGIFAAHSWLAGPHESYLGYWRRGGGALGEHSHAINLWQHLAREAGRGRVSEVSATVDYVEDGRTAYDRMTFLNLVTEDGLYGRVVQDVVTLPARKWCRVQGERSYVEIVIGAAPNHDAVVYRLGGGDTIRKDLRKSRRDDFIDELTHVSAVLQGTEADNPISLEHGIDTMRVVEAAHRSAGTGRVVPISRGATAAPHAKEAT